MASTEMKILFGGHRLKNIYPREEMKHAPER